MPAAEKSFGGLGRLRRRAAALAAPYPALLAEAERVSQIVAQGVHGRRRAGQGETFWQYRNYTQSDSVRQIDWRRSARADTHYVRENEWEAANTVWFWRDGDPGMDWQSSPKLPRKQDRASVILMALSMLLMKAGERCAVMGENERALTGRYGTEQIPRTLASSAGNLVSLDTPFPAHAKLVIASDFLRPASEWRATLARLSARPAGGILLHIIDPAERAFPFKGRTEFFAPGQTKIPAFLLGKAEKARTEYQAAFAAHIESMRDTARRLGWPLVMHETSAPPAAALTALYQYLSGDVR